MGSRLRLVAFRLMFSACLVVAMAARGRGGEAQEIDKTFQGEKLLRSPSPWALSSSFRAVAVSPSGTLVAAVTALNQLYVWDRSSGGVLLEDKASLPQGVSQIVFLGQDSLVAAGLDGKVLVFSLKPAKKPEVSEWPIWNPKNLGGAIFPTCLAVSGSTLYAARDRQIAAIDGARGEVLKRYDTPVFGPLVDDKPIRALAVGADGKHFYTGGDQILVWDAQTGAPLSKLASKARNVRCLAVSQDGSKLLSAGEGGWMEEWDLRGQGACVQLLPDQHPGSRVLALGYGDSAGQAYAAVETGAAIEFQDGKIKDRWRISEEPLEAAAILGREGLVLGGQGGMHLTGQGNPSWYRLVLWDLAGGTELTAPVFYRLYGASKGERLLAVSSSDLFLWSGPESKEARLPRLADALTPSVIISPVAMDSLGAHVYIAQKDGIITDAGLPEGKPIRQFRVRHQIYQLALSEDGSMLASGTNNGVDLVDLQDPGKVRSIDCSPDHLTGLACSRSGNVVAIGMCGDNEASLELRGGRSGDLLSKVGLEFGTPWIRFGSDDRDLWIANGSKTVYHWRSKDGILDRIPVGETVRRVFPVDPNRIVVAGEHCLLLVDSRSGKILKEGLTHPDRIMDVIFVPERNAFFSSWMDGSLRSTAFEGK